MTTDRSIDAAGLLIDSNAIIAALASEHEHHAPSRDLIFRIADLRFAVAAHSYSEAFNHLTKPRGLFRRRPETVRDSLTALRANSRLVGLTPQQTLAAIGRFAELGGVGARLYDYLIGECARRSGLGRLITWNTAHMRGLFPDLEVMTPAEALALR